MEFEYFRYHPSISNPDFSKTYSLYRRYTHHHNYLLCLFIIQKL